jgi:hypothetical protein
MQKFIQPDTQFKFPIQRQDNGFACVTDRVYIYFPNLNTAKFFAKRNQKLLANLHRPEFPNNAGFMFAFDKTHGLKGRIATGCLNIYTSAIGVVDEQDTVILVCSVTNEEVIEAAVTLMGRRWKLSKATNFEELDGTYPKFKEFFLKNSEDADEVPVEAANVSN